MGESFTGLATLELATRITFIITFISLCRNSVDKKHGDTDTLFLFMDL
jgi:hypothetical protein